MSTNRFTKLPIISDESILGEYSIEVDRTKKIKKYNALISNAFYKKTKEINGYLSSFLMPTAHDHFYEKYWQKDCFFNPSNKGLTNLSHCLTINDILGGLTSKMFSPQDLRFVKNSVYSEAYNYEHLDQNGDRLKTFLNEKGSVVIDNIHQYIPKLNEIWQEMVEIFKFPITCTAYFTPAGTQTFPMHWDTDDVFVLQLEGVKDWSVHEPIIPDPLEHHIWGKYNYEIGRQLFQGTLQVNDILYIPRGFMHQAIASSNQASLHITIGICIPTWHRMIQTSMEKILLEVGQIMDFRQPTDIMISDSNLADNEAYFNQLKQILMDKFTLPQIKKSIWELLSRQEIRGVMLPYTVPSDLAFNPNFKFQKTSGLAIIENSDIELVLKFAGFMHFFPMGYRTIMEKIFIQKAPFALDDIETEIGSQEAKLLLNYLYEEGLIKQQ